MTRIFDALKKADASREAPAPHAPLPLYPVETPAAVPAARAAGAAPGALPLLGAVELGEDALREMAAVRMNLEAALRDRSPRVVMFLGSQGGEGTSTVALQFAQAMVRDHTVRTLLVDCHARRPAFGVDAGQRCAVLDPRLATGSPDQRSVVTSNLLVVPASEDSRRAGLIQPSILRHILDANAAGFDWVVLDGPPVLEAPDASPLGAVADGVLLVIQAGRTKRPVLTRAADLLGKAGSRVLGSVLNRRVLEIPEFIYRRI
jgi:Mrp family chromosome partitioning ATPase